LEGLLLLFAEDALLHYKFLVHVLGGFVLLEQRSQFFNVDMCGHRDDSKEEGVVKEDDCFIVFLNNLTNTTKGAKVLLRLAKYSVSYFSREGTTKVSTLLSAM
jgi:hypothetical protein